MALTRKGTGVIYFVGIAGVIVCTFGALPLVCATSACLNEQYTYKGILYNSDNATEMLGEVKARADAHESLFTQLDNKTSSLRARQLVALTKAEHVLNHTKMAIESLNDFHESISGKCFDKEARGAIQLHRLMCDVSYHCAHLRSSSRFSQNLKFTSTSSL
jgi:hypothetical protein